MLKIKLCSPAHYSNFITECAVQTGHLTTVQYLELLYLDLLTGNCTPQSSLLALHVGDLHTHGRQLTTHSLQLFSASRQLSRRTPIIMQESAINSWCFFCSLYLFLCAVMFFHQCCCSALKHVSQRFRCNTVCPTAPKALRQLYTSAAEL